MSATVRPDSGLIRPDMVDGRTIRVFPWPEEVRLDVPDRLPLFDDTTSERRLIGEVFALRREAGWLVGTVRLT